MNCRQRFDNPKVIELMCAIYLITKKCRLLRTVHNDDHIQQTVQTVHQCCHEAVLLQAWMQDVDVCIDLVLYLLKVEYFQWKFLIILIFFSDMTLWGG